MAIRCDSPFLPMEIIINILKRLPVKSLLRFQSVCKELKNLFKTPYFITEHYNHSAHKNPLLISSAFSCNPRRSSLCLLRYNMESLEIESIPAMFSLRRSWGIIGSCNGLLCVMLGYNDDGAPPSFLLLNPATREVKQVPRPTINEGSYGVFGWGFGFSPLVRDYKIVRIHTPKFTRVQINFNNVWVQMVEVYSLRTGSWKEVECGLIRSLGLRSKPITTNGAIFWLAFDFEDKDYHSMILSFDLAVEVFTLIPLPSSTYDTRSYVIHSTVLDVYENKVAMLHRYHVNTSSFIDLWVLEEVSGVHGRSWCWNKKYSIGPTSSLLQPKCIWRNEIVCRDFEVEWNRMLGNKSTFYVFNLTTDNELKKFHISVPAHELDGICNYAESLVSI
ncbi:hypothetical protein K1719_001994 [Acacia pycnantha]|nr:hypothetical protein K1719_001994 [Acacia pycnantha]